MAASAQHPIDLYYWPTPNGWKITIMLEEAGLPYTVHPINIGKGDQFKPEFLAISPNNKMPAIVDPDGRTASRSRFLNPAPSCNISAGRPASSIPPTSAAGRGGSMAVLADGRLRPDARPDPSFSNLRARKIPYAIDRYTNETNRLYGVLNKRLADRGFVAGEYSIADMAIAPWAKLWERQGQNIEEFPNVEALARGQCSIARPCSAPSRWGRKTAVSTT